MALKLIHRGNLLNEQHSLDRLGLGDGSVIYLATLGANSGRSLDSSIQPQSSRLSSPPNTPSLVPGTVSNSEGTEATASPTTPYRLGHPQQQFLEILQRSGSHNQSSSRPSSSDISKMRTFIHRFPDIAELIENSEFIRELSQEQQRLGTIDGLTLMLIN